LRWLLNIASMTVGEYPDKVPPKWLIPHRVFESDYDIIDNDGDQDIHEDMGGAFTGDVAHNVLFENPGHGNHWVKLKLEGVKSKPAAIGARIKVTVANPKGARDIYRIVCTGGSFGGNPFRQEIGLGDAQSIRTIEIFWPVTGQTQTFENVGMDRFYRIKEAATIWNHCR
jgi:hypothetical protein